MNDLAGCAMAVLSVQWFLPAQLVLDPSAMAAAFMHNLEALIFGVGSVGCSVMPILLVACDIVLLGASRVGHPQGRANEAVSAGA